MSRLLAPPPELSDLVRDMGVEQITHSDILARFVLPELDALQSEGRRQVLQHVHLQWSELKQSESLVTALMEVCLFNLHIGCSTLLVAAILVSTDCGV